MNLSITKATAENINDLAMILNEATAYKLQHNDNAWIADGNATWGKAEIKGIIDKGTTYLAWIDGAAIATISLEWDDTYVWGKQPPNAGYIHRVAVRNNQHGQKIGERLLDWASVEARAKGRRLLRLDCPTSNKKLCDYYQKLGFKPLDAEQIGIKTPYNTTLYEKYIA